MEGLTGKADVFAVEVVSCREDPQVEPTGVPPSPLPALPVSYHSSPVEYGKEVETGCPEATVVDHKDLLRSSEEGKYRGGSRPR